MHHHNKLPNYCAETCEMRWNVKNLLSHQSCFSEAYPFLLQRYLAYKRFFYLSGFVSNWSLLDVVRLCLPSPDCVSRRNPTLLLSTPLKPSFGQRCFLPSSQPLNTSSLRSSPQKGAFCHSLCSRLLTRPSASPGFVTFEALSCTFGVLSAATGTHLLPTSI